MNTIYTFYYEVEVNGVAQPFYRNVEAEDEQRAYHSFVDYVYHKELDVDKVSRGVYLSRKMEKLRAEVDKYWNRMQQGPEDAILPMRYTEQVTQKTNFVRPLTLRDRTG